MLRIPTPFSLSAPHDSCWKRYSYTDTHSNTSIITNHLSISNGYTNYVYHARSPTVNDRHKTTAWETQMYLQIALRALRAARWCGVVYWLQRCHSILGYPPTDSKEILWNQPPYSAISAADLWWQCTFRRVLFHGNAVCGRREWWTATPNRLYLQE